MVAVWRSEDNHEHLSSPSTVFETASLCGPLLCAGPGASELSYLCFPSYRRSAGVTDASEALGSMWVLETSAQVLIRTANASSTETHPQLRN